VCAVPTTHGPHGTMAALPALNSASAAGPWLPVGETCLFLTRSTQKFNVARVFGSDRRAVLPSSLTTPPPPFHSSGCQNRLVSVWSPREIGYCTTWPFWVTVSFAASSANSCHVLGGVRPAALKMSLL